MKFLGVTLASQGLISVASISNEQKVSYDGWKVFRINGSSNTAIFQDVVDRLQLDVWKGRPSSGNIVDVSVPPEKLSPFEASTKGCEIEVMHENLGVSIADESKFAIHAGLYDRFQEQGITKKLSAGAMPNKNWFNSYHSLADHYQWISDLAAAYPSNSEIISAGESFEGRDIKGIHIWGSSGKGSQQAVVLHSTMHARDWITTMVAEYTAYQLLVSTDSTTAAFKDQYDFYIFPIVNPDGFYYSQNFDRLWRKNRQPTPDHRCFGLDINRNWPHKSWKQSFGASTSPCSAIYKGSSAGDGVETKALKTHLDSLAAGMGIKLYIDFHAYGQLWMYPHGYSSAAEFPNRAAHHMLIAKAANFVGNFRGTRFTVGQFIDLLGPVSGSSIDYAFDNVNATYSMHLDLRDEGRHGFLLPPDLILPSGEEIWDGLDYLLKYMA